MDRANLNRAAEIHIEIEAIMKVLGSVNVRPRMVDLSGPAPLSEPVPGQQTRPVYLMSVMLTTRMEAGALTAINRYLEELQKEVESL